MAFGEQWEQRYRRRWWQKVIDGPLDVLAFLLQLLRVAGGWANFGGEEDEEPNPSLFSSSEKDG
jgi:hypothetical protein